MILSSCRPDESIGLLAQVCVKIGQTFRPIIQKFEIKNGNSILVKSIKV